MIDREIYSPRPAVSAPGWKGRNRFSGWAIPIPVSSKRIVTCFASDDVLSHNCLVSVDAMARWLFFPNPGSMSSEPENLRFVPDLGLGKDSCGGQPPHRTNS